MARPARPWFRFYSEVLESRKVQRLKPPLFKHWVNLMALANIGTPRGTLPSVEDIGYRLRLSDEQAQNAIEELVALRLIDSVDGGFVMHDWPEWQKDRDIPASNRQGFRDLNHANRDLPASKNAGATHALYIEEEVEEEEEGDKEKEGEVDGERRVPVPRLFEQCFARLLSPMEREQIQALVEEHPYDRIDYAVREAAASNARSVRFIQRVCERLANDGNTNGANSGVAGLRGGSPGVEVGLSDLERLRAAVAARGQPG